MLHSNLKFNITPTTSFQDTQSSRITGHAKQIWGYEKKICEHLYIYLIALGHQTNIIPNSQLVKEIINLENLANLIGL